MLGVFGLLGFLMRRFDYPIAPVVVGLILGPVAESQLRRALQISLGDPMVLLQSPISATLLGIAVIALMAPVRAAWAGSVQSHRGLNAPDPRKKRHPHKKARPEPGFFNAMVVGVTAVRGRASSFRRAPGSGCIPRRSASRWRFP